MARRLLPAALLIPVGIGWLRWQGELHGLYTTAFGVTLFSAANVLVFALLIWRSAQILNRLDAQRAAAESSMRQLADSLPQFVWTTDSHGATDYFNQRCFEYNGLNFEQTRDGGWVDAIHPDEVRHVMESRGRAFANRQPYTMEYRFKRASDGMYRWQLARGIPLFDATGTLVRWLGTCTDIHDIKMAEQASRNNEAQFRQLANFTPQLVWTATGDGNIDYYNQRWYDYTGLTFEQSENWGWEAVLHPDDLQNTITRWTNAFITHEPYEMEFRLKRAADGVQRWHLGRAFPVRDAQGTVVRWFGTCTDIHALKLAEEAVRASELRFKQLADSMPQMVWAAAPDGAIDYYNQRWHDYTGMTFEQTKNWGWEPVLHPDDLQNTIDRWTQACETCVPYEIEYRFKRADGVYRWHLGRALPIRDAQGAVVRWFGTSTDIHEIKLTEEALRRSELQFKQLADAMPQIVWAATPDGNIDYSNQRWLDYTGISFEDTKNLGWRLVLHPDDARNTQQQRTTALSTGAPYQIEYRFKRADGMYRWHLGQAQPIRDAQGIIVRWFGTCTDIEDYKQAGREIKLLNESLEQRVEQRTAELALANHQLADANRELNESSLRLVQSNRELQDFASVASHDLQEPLRKVQAFGDRLKSVARTAMDTEGRDYLDRMLNATKRMKSLIEDLLKLARVTSQAQPFQPLNLSQVARDVLSDLEVRIAATNALVDLDPLPTIEADAVQMRQLLQNLIGNALKFHHPGKPPAIHVYAELPDPLGPQQSFFRLIVEDQGIGFDEKYLDRIFAVFQRLHGRAEYEGTGVGLAICRKIAQRHGGEITAASTPDQGARFVVTLPFLPPNSDSAGIPSTPAGMESAVTVAGRLL